MERVERLLTDRAYERQAHHLEPPVLGAQRQPQQAQPRRQQQPQQRSLTPQLEPEPEPEPEPERRPERRPEPEPSPSPSPSPSPPEEASVPPVLTIEADSADPCEADLDALQRTGESSVSPGGSGGRSRIRTRKMAPASPSVRSPRATAADVAVRGQGNRPQGCSLRSALPLLSPRAQS